MGIAALEWNPIDKNILAIATLKTNRLEIWAVDQGKMIGIMDLNIKVSMIKWSAHDPAQLVILERTDNVNSLSKKLLLVDYRANT